MLGYYGLFDPRISLDCSGKGSFLFLTEVQVGGALQSARILCIYDAVVIVLFLFQFCFFW